LPPQVDTVSFYYIDIQPATGTGEPDKSAFSMIRCYPNPAGRTAELLFSQPQGSEVTFRIVGVDGKTVYCETVVAGDGLNTKLIDVSELPESAYLVQVSNGIESGWTKLFISR
jgi:hypothetical protein